MPIANVEGTTEVLFLGFAERAQMIQEGSSPFAKWNILGLKQTIFSFFCPFSLRGLKWVVAIRIGVDDQIRLKVRADDESEIGWVEIKIAGSLQDLSSEPATITSPQIGSDVAFARHVFIDPKAWTVMLLDVRSEPQLMITRPGHYSVYKTSADGETKVGSFSVLLWQARPLDAQRIAAIRSDPKAAKAVRVQLSCKNCSSKLYAFAALDKAPEVDGYKWYTEIPDEFRCECGSTVVDARGIKHSLHEMLGHQFLSPSSELTLAPLYEKSSLLEVRRMFLDVLNSSPLEEVIQKFIQDNPVLLHQFPAEKLFFKPAILTFFKADFAILSPQKELILIEIESTKTRLMSKGGDTAQPLNHAIDQVRNWLHVADEHRQALLASLKIHQVSSVRGVVIAGRDQGYDPAHLRRLKGSRWERVTFLTFDDIASSLGGLAESFGSL